MTALFYNEKSTRCIAKQFKTTHPVVMRIIREFEERSTLDYRPREGRPRKLNSAEKRYILRLIRKDRSITWVALTNKAEVDVCQNTIKNFISEQFKRKWKARKRSKITPKKGKTRLQWCKAWIEDVEELEEIINSDETSIDSSIPDNSLYVFRNPGEAFAEEVVNPTERHQPAISVMFWGGIWKTGRTHIIPMTRDPRSKSKGYTAWSYQKALEEGLLPAYDGTRRFQHDNAPIHVAASSMKWLMQHGIELLDWPPNSPDLSPIEKRLDYFKAITVL